jgi:hypothetical protein
MIYIDEIQLEERNNNSAIKWGVVILLYSIVLAFVLKIPILSNPNEIINYNLLTFVGLLYISTWVIRILVFIWIIRIAQKLNRPMIVWGLFGLIFPSITLIIIGLQDYKVEDDNIKEIIDKVRLDFRAEIQHIQSLNDLSENELEKKKLDIKEKYSNELREKVGKYIELERQNVITKDNQNEKEDRLVFELDDDNTTQIESENWNRDITKCPACGAKINDKMTICYDCGLTINSA